MNAKDGAAARLFFALWPDDKTRAALRQWQTALHASAGGRRMHVEDLHLTLAFLGHSPAGTIERAAAAADSVQARRFHWQIDSAAYWPHNRIVWASAAHAPQELKALAEALRAALSAANIPFDKKALLPHVTLIRDARSFAPISLPPIDWSVDRFVLMQSVPSAQPRYHLLRQWPAV